MPFVSINNLEIPVVAGGELTPVEIGQQGRVYSGGYLRNRRAIKRRWRFRTSIVDDAFAQTIIGMIQGRGHLFTFDDASTDPVEAADNDSTVSGSGLIPSTLTGCTIHANTAVDGLGVTNIYTAPATTDNAAARTQALGQYDSSNNELPANQRIGDHSGATPFTAVAGAVLSDETTKVFSESADKHSVKVVCSATDDGARSAQIAAVSGETWTASVYLLGNSGGETVEVRLVANGSGASSAKSVTLSATEWRRVWVTHTCGASTAGVYMRVLSDDGAMTYYCDNWQLEEKDFVTAWYNGDRSSDDALIYDGSWLNDGPGISFSLWSNGASKADTGTSNGRILSFGVDASNEYLVFWRSSTNGTLFHQYETDGSVDDSGTGSTAVAYGNWVHIAGVWDFDAGTLKLYKNGTLGDTLTGLTKWSSDIATLGVGNSLTGNVPLGGELDDVLVVPYIMDTNMITALYNSGTAPTIGNHRLILSGDCIPDSSVTVVGQVNSAAFRPAQQSTWQENNRVVDFTLFEV